MADRTAMETRLEALAMPLVEAHGLELVEVEFLPRSNSALVRVYLDRPGGISLDQIETFSREFGTVLDVEDPIPQAFTLEVSSPGLTRPLKKVRHYQWAKGKLVRVVPRVPVDGLVTLVGTLIEVGEDEIVVEVEGEPHVVQLDTISKANLEYVGE
ncbi:MAG: ribosome maturation factor RimP [Chrysiogenetes bacterium]|nr:ribosome maturation factor RimP [Chrysiogenetes bacterium]